MNNAFSKHITFLALLSGIVVAMIHILSENFNLPGVADLAIILFGAGAIYGLFTAVSIYREFDSKKLSTLVWILASTLSYGLAVQATLLFAPSIVFPNPGPMEYMLGGLVGALILVSAAKLIHHLNKKPLPAVNMVVALVCGALIPLLLFALIPKGLDILLLCVIWPTVVTAVIFTKKVKNLEHPA